MRHSKHARTAARRTRSTVLAALVVLSATLIGVRVYQSRASSSASTASPIDMRHGDHHGAPGEVAAGAGRDDDTRVPAGAGRPNEAPGHAGAPPLERDTGEGGRAPRAIESGEGQRREPARAEGGRGQLGQADGAVPDAVTAFDAEFPAVANLDPDLLRALRQAATDAADDGVELFVTSGWRSPRYQEQLRREAVSTYGSEKEAARWVATPDTSPHVSGDAVDIGPTDAMAWLSNHGARYGLCRIYRNEPWHYELRPKAIDHGCPPLFADPTRDPRMTR
jgi:hypothetical protein